jgi:pimeloyl-ACP methyl ester carboxylesterase
MDEDLVELDGGRCLAYRSVGPATGFPLFLFHGLAESRLTAHPDEDILEHLGIRLVTMDRPGVGLSDPHPKRKLLDWPHDLTTLADHLGHQQFAIMGHSAGAPYVAACAYAIPERLLSASIVSGISPPSSHLVRPMLASEFWKIGLFLFCLPFATRPVIWAGIKYARPRADQLYARHLSHLVQADRDVMADQAMKDMRIQSMLEAFRQGPEGLCEDITLLRRPWGFDIGAISMPIRIWHGELDKIVDISFGRELGRILPNSTCEFREGLGHNMIFSHWQEILSSTKEDGCHELVLKSDLERERCD